MRKLLSIDTPLANFFASGLLALGPKLGPILWQFPPRMKFDSPRFENFFKLLPRSTKQAATLARTCDDRMLSRACLDAAVDIPVRHAVEIRHESFVCPEFIDLLRVHNIGLVVADTVEWPLLMDVTSDFVYIRLHGSQQLYASGYDAEAIDLWTRRIQAFSTGKLAAGAHAHPVAALSRPRDVYVYFDNDMKVRAPFDAKALQNRLAGLPPDPDQDVLSRT